MKPVDFIKGVHGPEELEERRVIKDIYEPYYDQNMLGNRWFCVEKDHALALRKQAINDMLSTNKFQLYVT